MTEINQLNERNCHWIKNKSNYLLSTKKKNQFRHKEKEWRKRHNAATAKSLQSCPTLCDPIDRSPPGSPVPGILQARTLEWVAISFSNA